ncbi:MAG: ATP-binding protein [Acidobacteria bacterium]|nr:ATP-binding protein [Acidobacteriota bacterium]
MMRFFNTAGPCKPDIHYMLPAAARLPGVKQLIDQKSYFVLHAPRQTGKTTTVMELARELTGSGRYVAVMVSMESGAPFSDDPGAAEWAMLGAWRRSASVHLPADLQPPPWPEAKPGERIGAALHTWSLASPRPLVMFLDEIDALRDDALLSVLRQLRAGYPDRPQGFPWSLALIGLRDIRDYKIASGGSDRLRTTSPFNIKVESLTLRDFTAHEVAALYEQHTVETGQVFMPEALQRAFELTRGQPWLVNALARQATQFLEPDPKKPITVETIDRAKEILIERQDTHLDSLAERLREPRVRQIIEPMLAGRLLTDVPQDDIRFVVDLGLARLTNGSSLEITNPIYREVIPRALATTARASLPRMQPTWLKADGGLDTDKLLEAFLKFWRQHGQPLLRAVHYHEVAPQIVMMAFLHRVANAGGTLEREYAIGSGRIDLCLRYGQVTLGIEMKVWRDGRPDPLKEGLEQLDEYLSGLGQETGWLVIFDQRAGLPEISERTTTETAVTPTGRQVTVIRG